MLGGVCFNNDSFEDVGDVDCISGGGGGGVCYIRLVKYLCRKKKILQRKANRMLRATIQEVRGESIKKTFLSSFLS